MNVEFGRGRIHVGRCYRVGEGMGREVSSRVGYDCVFNKQR